MGINMEVKIEEDVNADTKVKFSSSATRLVETNPYHSEGRNFIVP